MKFIIRLFTILGISWICYSIPTKFLTLDYFNIKKINIKGNPKILLMELTELGNTTYNSNIWDLNFQTLEEELKKDIRIKNIKLENKALGELTINIEEKEFIYYVQIKNKIYLVDNQGSVFGTFKEREKKDIPLIVADSKDDIFDLIKILDSMSDYILKELVSQIYKKDKNCVEMILIDGTVIKTNSQVEKTKYKVVETLYFELIKSKKIEYIDLRFNDFIVKSMGEKSDDK